ncbi:MAG: SHOCT domain-containing protein [Balneola sp.]
MKFSNNSNFCHNRKQILFLLLVTVGLVMVNCFSTPRIGSGYNKYQGAEKEIGHAMLFFMGSASVTVNVRTNGEKIDEFRLTPNSYTIYPMRRIGEVYEFKYRFTSDGIGTKYVGGHTFTFTSERNSVHGANIMLNNRLLDRSYSSDQEKFTGKVAQEILNPAFSVYEWQDMVNRNRSMSNVADEKIQGKDEKSIKKKLEELNALFEKGLISKEEYEKLRSELLKKI